MKINIYKLAITISALLVSQNIIAGTPTIFPTVNALFHNFQDYSIEKGTFKILKTKPLHIWVGSEETMFEDPQFIEEDIKRSIVYGIYRSFIHTNVQEITVTSEAKLLKFDHKKPLSKEINFMAQFKKTVSIKRDKALALIQKFSIANNFSDLVADWSYEGMIDHDQWSRPAKRTMYNDQGLPGLNIFFNELIKP